MRQIFRNLAIAALVLCVTLPVFAGQNLAIIEGGDPVGNTLQLVVKNSSAEAKTGTVVAKVALADGKLAVRSAKVTVAGDGFQTTTVIFEDDVYRVLSLGITEGPDPIPQ